MAKAEPKTPTSIQRDAARAARNDRVQEVVLLLSWLTKLDVEAHLSLVDFAQPSSTATMNYVVCVHHGGKRLAWRVSDFEVLEYFQHLETRQCPRGLSRAEKMDYLAVMAGKPA